MAASLPILTFHALEDRTSVIAIPPRVFHQGLARLHASGYRTVSLLEAADCVRRKIRFPARALVLTFDDGYESVYGEAFPVLQRYGMTATVFLTVGNRGRETPTERLPSLNGRPMLSWREILAMQREGIEFGAHTLTHPDLTRLSPGRLAEEVCGSKTILEEALGVPVSTFAYPYGRYDRRSRELVREHFECACSDELGFLTAESPLDALERVEAYYLRTERLFGLLETPWLPWYLLARNLPRRLRRVLRPHP